MGSNLSKILEEERRKESEEVVLSQQNIKEIPPQISFLKDTCERLDFSGNLLSNVPYELAKLGHLRVLILARNEFRFIPSVITEIKTLEELDLSRNKITKLPRTIADLPNLRVLDLTRNRILQVPKAIANMSQLKVLRISENPLVYPPKGVLRRPKGMTDEDWLIKLKDWLNYEGIKRQTDPSFLDPSYSSSSLDSEVAPRGSNVRQQSRISHELVQRAESIEELRKAHLKQREKLARQLDLDIRVLRDKHDKELRREQERHQQFRKISEQNCARSDSMGEPIFASLSLASCEELFRSFYGKEFSRSSVGYEWLLPSVHLVNVLYQLLPLLRFILYLQCGNDEFSNHLVDLYETIAWQVSDLCSVLLDLMENEKDRALSIALMKDSLSIFLLIFNGYRRVLQMISGRLLSTEFHKDIQCYIMTTLLHMNASLMSAKQGFSNAILAISGHLKVNALPPPTRSHSQAWGKADEGKVPKIITRRSFTMLPQQPIAPNPRNYTSTYFSSENVEGQHRVASRPYTLQEVNPLKFDRPVAIHPAQLQRERWNLRVQAHQHQQQQKFSSPSSPYLASAEDRRSFTYSPSPLSNSRRTSHQKGESPSHSPIRRREPQSLSLAVQDVCGTTIQVVQKLDDAVKQLNTSLKLKSKENTVVANVDMQGYLARVLECPVDTESDVYQLAKYLRPIVEIFDKMNDGDASVEALMPLKNEFNLVTTHAKQLEGLIGEPLGI